ncbi:MAG: hypothetical protein QOH49_933 [Acidobacteriota bacterium]|jgi:hypothetical protein|nr:hypothetical protein [Acidobacteriota bacterium]
MKVFISWSGDRSKAVAEALYAWLPTVILTIRPWLSLADIDKGARWRTEVASELEDSQVGIICLTPENLNAPWLLFEAGALSKIQQKSYVCTFLYDLEPTDVREPLAQFQHTLSQKEDVKKLIHTINRAQGEKRFTDAQIDKAFERGWPELAEDLNKISNTTTIQKSEPTQKEMLKELLELVRAQTRRDHKVFLFTSKHSVPYGDLHSSLADSPKGFDRYYDFIIENLEGRKSNPSEKLKATVRFLKAWEQFGDKEILGQQSESGDKRSSDEGANDENSDS